VVSRNSAQRRHRPDYWLLLLPASLLVVGLIVVYSISPGLAAQRADIDANYIVNKQIVAIFIGIVAFAVAAFIPARKWLGWQKLLIIAAVAAAVAVRLFGEESQGAYRWIQISGLSFQAVELIKWALLIWLAAFLVQRKKEGLLADKKRTLRPLFVVLAVLGFVVAVVQSDLGSAGVLVAMMVGMSFMAGMPIRRILFIGGIIIAGTILAISTTGYRRDRLMTFIQPERDCQTTGYQACQALVAVGSGGLFGKGLAQSVQAYGYLPQAADDSIFAIYAEKFGFVGVTVLLGLFLVLFNRMRRVIERAPDEFTRLVVVGVFAWLSTQTIINIGAMLGLLPLKGITLPFISYGGTSIIFVTAAMGVVFNISRYTTYGISDDSGQKHDSRTAFRYDARRRRAQERGIYGAS
jgi:cell division protein FtsW